MTIEVITRGTPPAEKIYYVMCGNCKSQLRFSRSDAQYISDQREGDALKITCPVCSKDVWAKP